MIYKWLHSIYLHLTKKQNFLGNKFASHNFLSNVIIPQSMMLIVKHFTITLAMPIKHPVNWENWAQLEAREMCDHISTRWHSECWSTYFHTVTVIFLKRKKEKSSSFSIKNTDVSHLLPATKANLTSSVTSWSATRHENNTRLETSALSELLV